MISASELKNIETDTKNQAYEIINKKGATYYGIGACVTRIVNCIFNDENRVLPVSTYDNFSDCFFGFPTIVGRKGIVRRLDTELTEMEAIRMQSSINVIKRSLREVL